MDDEIFNDDSDEDDEDGVFMIPGLLMAGPEDSSNSHLVNNSEDWHDGAYPFTLADVAVTTLGLAANLAKVVNIFFLDLRHDMCAARNQTSKRRQVAEFDADLAALPIAPAATDG